MSIRVGKFPRGYEGMFFFLMFSGNIQSFTQHPVIELEAVCIDFERMVRDEQAYRIIS